MSTVAPVLFRSSASGAPALSGEVAKLLDVLDHCLIIGRVFSYNGSSYFDNSVEARTQAGTAFAPLPDGDTNDICYFGSSQKFKHLRFDLDTPGSGGTYVWEYWDGGSWATLTVTDNTSGFTQDGTVVWTAPAGWATTAVNSVTQYWVRVRASAGPSTNPTVYSVTAMGWLRYTSPDPGSNIAVYRQGAGNQFYVWVRDDGTDTDARNAATRGYEDWPGQVKPFPTVAQGTNYVRKSGTADSTARAWQVLADDRTFYLFVFTEDVAGFCQSYAYGDFYSYVPGDLYRTMCIGKSVIENAVVTNDHFAKLLGTNSLSTMRAGHYIARAHTGLGESVAAGKHSDTAKGAATAATRNWSGLMPTWNGPDGGLYLAPVTLHHASTVVRGHLRGTWVMLHGTSAVAVGDVFSGTGPFAARTFEVVGPMGQPDASPGGTNTGWYIVETSDTWDTN